MDKLRDLLSGRDMICTHETVAAIETRHAHLKAKKQRVAQAFKPTLSTGGDVVKPTLECTYCKELENFKFVGHTKRHCYGLLDLVRTSR